MAQIIETVPFSYKEVRESVDSEFKQAGYDVSIGSNVSQLSNVIAYAVSMLNASTALNINETLLSYATKRENIVDVAKNFSYEPTKAKSYAYNLTLKFKHGAKYFIPKHAEFKANGLSYYMFSDAVELTATEDNDTTTVYVKEGKFTSYNDDAASLIHTVTETRYYFDIPYINVENDGLEVFVSYYDKFGVYHEKEAFSEHKSAFIEQGTNYSTQYIRRDNSNYKTPRIYFKYAGSGENLPTGSTVYINVLTTSGIQGSMGDIEPNEVKSSYPGVTVESIELVNMGQEEEGIESIRENAPLLHNTANRLVTANDYIAFCKKDTRIADAIVWGGNEEFPKSPGHIWFSFKPSVDRLSYTKDSLNLEFTLDNAEFNWDYSLPELNIKENEVRADSYYNRYYLPNMSIRSTVTNKHGNVIAPGIFDDLSNLAIPTLVYHHRHPIFCQFNYEVDVLKFTLYDDQPQIRSDIFDLVKNAFDGTDALQLSRFGVEYFNASLIKRIDERVTDSSGFNMKVQTNLVLNKKTLTLENQNPDNRDIYIPLAVPYEEYFDKDGYLISDLLPSIDTPNFARYKTVEDFPYHYQADLYTDWGWLKADKENKQPQKLHKLIIAPVRIKHKFRWDFNANNSTNHVITLPFYLAPDGYNSRDPNSITDDLKDADNETLGKTGYNFNDTRIWLYTRGVDESDNDLLEADEWTWNEDDPNKITLITGKTIDKNTYVVVEYDGMAGFYYLFNSYRKDILIHLFVDGAQSGYKAEVQSNTEVLGDNFAASYLYSLDDMYLFTSDDYYLVTESGLDINTHYVETTNYTPKSYLTTSYTKAGELNTSAATQPQSYLYTQDMKYLYTVDSYYLTTEGYVQVKDEIDEYTGSLVKQINERMYRRSVLKSDLFLANRYLNLKYPSYNFKCGRNVIPMLRSFVFKDIRDVIADEQEQPENMITVYVNATGGLNKVDHYRFAKGTTWRTMRAKIELPYRQDYTFTHFALARDGSPIDNAYSLTEDITIYACYVFNMAIIKVTVIEPENGYTTVQEFKVSSNTTWAIVKNQIYPKLTQEFGDYIFSHISETQDGAELDDLYQIGNKEYEFYAVYKFNRCVISFNTKGGTQLTDIKVTKGTQYRDIKDSLPKPDLQEFEFLYYSTEFDGGEISDEYSFDSDAITLYAIYYGYQYVDINVFTQGGVPEQDLVRVMMGVTFADVKKELTEPTKQDYKFIGWALDPNGDNMIDDEYIITG